MISEEDAVPHIQVNGDRFELAVGVTLAQVVGTVAPIPRGVAVAVNDEVIPRAQWGGIALRAGDRIEILTAVQGG